MKRHANSGSWVPAFIVAVAGLANLPSLHAQGTMMPSTLRYGSGFFNAPAASTLPHLAITGTYSGFGISVDDRVIASPRGLEKGRLPPRFSQWAQDVSVAVGLFDRVELGASLQNFSDADSGGNMVGAFGRVALLDPASSGVGLAVGARFVSAPSLPGNHDYMPTRLGIPDIRFYGQYREAWSTMCPPSFPHM